VGNTLREEMIRQLANDAKKIGVSIKAEPKDFAALVDQLTVGDYEAILIGLTGGVAVGSGANVYQCDGNLHMWNVDCPKNTTEFEKQLDALYRRGLATLDTEVAKGIFEEAQLLMGEFQPMVQLVQGNSLFAYRTDVLLNHDRAPFGNQDVVYCANGKCRGG
jgi:peptide/nickel transport system substrate-binding protein